MGVVNFQQSKREAGLLFYKFVFNLKQSSGIHQSLGWNCKYISFSLKLSADPQNS